MSSHAPESVVSDAAAWRTTRASVIAWVLYDLANTTFALGVGSRYFAPWVVQTQGGRDWWIGLSTACAMLVVIIAAPWIGALSDHVGKRRPFLIGSTLGCVAATALLATGGVRASLVLYGVATVGFNLGAVVYDSLLADVSTERNRGLVSGLGVSVGYAGSALALGLGAFVLPRFGYAWVFRSFAAAFLIFALPAFVWVRDRPRESKPGKHPGVTDSPGMLLRAWREAGRYPGVVRFLTARFLYTDAINTDFQYIANYAKLELRLSDQQTNVLALAGILAAGLGALVAGRSVDRLGPRAVLHSALYALVIAVVVAIGAKASGLPALGWMVGLAGGSGLGSVWAADRVYMTRLSPADKLGQFFGLYAAVGRFATVLGPLVWGLVADGLGLGRTAALAVLGGFVVVALIILQGVHEPDSGAVGA
ncbi:MAG: MFS transporter [Coriobacteriales bacterium]